MKSSLVVLTAFIAFTACAKIVDDVPGVGSGDDFAQALAEAKVNAILNGGQILTGQEVDGDRLVKDEGEVRNEAFLVSYEVVGKRESKFDGTEVRIKARVSDDESDFTLKNGSSQVTGEGAASDSSEATVIAMCNAVIESGAMIKAVVRYENDELVADDSTIDAKGFAYAGDVAKAAGKSTVSCLVLGSAREYVQTSPSRAGGEGIASNAMFAEAVARRRMLLDHGSEFSVHKVYKNGSLAEFTASRSRGAYISSAKVDPVVDFEGRKLVRMSASLAETSIASSIDFMPGWGYGADAVAAHEAALCDAVVNYASRAEVSASYDNGRETGSSAEYTGYCNYIGEDFKSVSRADGGFLCETTVKTVSSLPSVAADIAQTVETVGFGSSKSEAVDDAKQRAVDSVFGSAATVRMSECNGRITMASYRATHSGKGYVDKCDVISEDESSGMTIVTIKALVKNHDGDSTGWGWVTGLLVIFGLTALFMAAKKLGVVFLTIVWILAAACLFIYGHWVVGIFAILLGIGAANDDK